MSFFKKITINLVCMMILFSCNGNKKNLFIGLDKTALWNSLCEKSNDRSGVIYAIDYPKDMKGDVSITLKTSKTDFVPEIFLKANKWKWQPADENLQYIMTFDGDNKVLNVEQHKMK
jgi:hypothetical protein